VDLSGKPWLDGLAAFDASAERYRYNRTGEDNADAHLEHQLMGPEVVWAVIAERLVFNTWEQVSKEGRQDERA